MALRSHGNSYSTGEYPHQGTILPKPRGKPRKIATPAPTADETPKAKVGRIARKPLIELEAEARDKGLDDVIEQLGIKPRKGVVITKPSFDIADISIRGTTPLVLHKFSQKVRDTIRSTQEMGQQAKKGRTREARDFDLNYQNAMHRSREGWLGIPASAFRNACIAACRAVGFKMTIAKMSIFIKADGFDEDGTGLVRITSAEPPHMDVRPGRNANGGVDLRSRPMWAENWTATVRVRWDTDQFSATDVANLMCRAGQQVGVGEGRPDSKMSAGCGWGEFEVTGL